MFTQIIIACTMFYCTTKTITPHVEYTENIVSCVDWLHNRADVRITRVNKKTFMAKIKEKWEKVYYTKCDLIINNK